MSTLGKYLKVSIQHAVLSNGEWNSLINFNVLILRVMQPGREEEEKRILSLPLQNLKTYTKIETIRELLGFFCELITPIILASSEKPGFMSSSFFFCFFFFFFFLFSFSLLDSENPNYYCLPPTIPSYFFGETVISSVMKVLHFYALCFLHVCI